MAYNRKRPLPKWLQKLAVVLALRMSERTGRTYLDADALDGIADSLVASFAAEELGAVLMALPRDRALRISGIG